MLLHFYRCCPYLMVLDFRCWPQLSRRSWKLAWNLMALSMETLSRLMQGFPNGVCWDISITILTPQLWISCPKLKHVYNCWTVIGSLSLSVRRACSFWPHASSCLPAERQTPPAARPGAVSRAGRHGRQHLWLRTLSSWPCSRRKTFSTIRGV